ncbi:hypothetical protein [Solitalea koreensis]|uniref:Lipoprotein n=1 Tax=Solitalea koreensis TaxID=543615 RepID=A0A521DWG5_9SPHI|nr:hypothetical protein [Solitalea koreensis]SMO76079.1 hypothetical protein SAMN06265350_10923 [Solitalea koreensis]
MKKIKSFLLLLSFAMLFFSCNNNNDIPGYTQGVIRFTSPTGSDPNNGCGYVIDINGATYSPVSLDSKYQVNNMVVYVQYQTTGQRVTCKDAPNGLEQISIQNIRSK